QAVALDRSLELAVALDHDAALTRLLANANADHTLAATLLAARLLLLLARVRHRIFVEQLIQLLTVETEDALVEHELGRETLRVQPEVVGETYVGAGVDRAALAGLEQITHVGADLLELAVAIPVAIPGLAVAIPGLAVALARISVTVAVSIPLTVTRLAIAVSGLAIAVARIAITVTVTRIAVTVSGLAAGIVGCIVAPAPVGEQQRQSGSKDPIGGQAFLHAPRWSHEMILSISRL